MPIRDIVGTRHGTYRTGIPLVDIPEGSLIDLWRAEVEPTDAETDEYLFVITAPPDSGDWFVWENSTAYFAQGGEFTGDVYRNGVLVDSGVTVRLGDGGIIDVQIHDLSTTGTHTGDPVEFPENVDSAYLYTAYIDGEGEITVLPGSVLAERADETSVSAPTAQTEVIAYAPHVATGGIASVPSAVTGVEAYAPAVASGASVAVPTAETVSQGYAPQVSTGASVALPAALTDSAAFAPDIIAGAVLVEVPAAVTEFAAQAPEVSSGASVTVPVAESAVSAIAPTVASGASVTVPTAATEMTAVAPDVTVTRHVNIVVPVAETTAEAYAPEITGGRVVVIPIAETAATAYAPLIQAGALVRITVAETEVIAYPPTVVSGQPRFRRSFTLEGRYIRSITLAA